MIHRIEIGKWDTDACGCGYDTVKQARLYCDECWEKEWRT
jgi:hypothetical protein